MNAILVTGAAGFIGSHTCCSLIESGYTVFAIDSLSHSNLNSLERFKLIFSKSNLNISEKFHFFKGDIRDKGFMDSVFKNAKKIGTPIIGVIHFAGLKAVAESVLNPIKYWENNVTGSINLIQSMKDNDCKKIVFSSSATVYGEASDELIKESAKINPTNPYGSTKYVIEKFLNDIHRVRKDEWEIAILRYFNPIGSHPSGLIGESPLNKPNNVFPLIINAAYEKKNLQVFGNDWPTYDGTCIRDYIHIMDLAQAHIKALNFLIKNKSQLINLNIGTGRGHTVLDLIKTFEKVNNIKVPYIFSNRREGDVCKLVANNEKAIRTLDWNPTKSLKEMCRDGWNWKLKNPNGYS